MMCVCGVCVCDVYDECVWCVCVMSVCDVCVVNNWRPVRYCTNTYDFIKMYTVSVY